MVKRIILVGVALMMCLGIFSGCGDPDDSYTYKEGDFSLEIAVQETEVRLGEKIEVTATLKNLSGREVPIKMELVYDYEILKDRIFIELFEENSEHDFAGLLPVWEKDIIIEKDAVITKTANVQILVKAPGCYDTMAGVLFFAEKGYKKRTSVFSESIKIYVTEGETE